MSSQNSSNLQRLMDLLADRATTGIDPAEQAELDALLAAEPDLDAEAFDRAAAALAVGLAGEPQGVQQLPSDLMAKLEVQALQAVSRSGTNAGDAAVYEQKASRALGSDLDVSRSLKMTRPPSQGWKVWAGWLAAAACLALAAVAWMRPAALFGPGSGDVRSLVDNAAGTVSRTWGAWPAKENEPAAEVFPNAASVKGKVVWNQQLQKGYMVFSDLKRNDPASKQYQLWIIDKNQTNPIDGGVFDIAQNGEVIIPITAKLAVKDPVGFAVTVEPPGGVVVSDQNRRVVVALLGS